MACTFGKRFPLQGRSILVGGILFQHAAQLFVSFAVATGLQVNGTRAVQGFEVRHGLQAGGVLVVGFQLRDLGEDELGSTEVLLGHERLALVVEVHQVFALHPLEIGAVMIGYIQHHTQAANKVLIALGLQVGRHGLGLVVAHGHVGEEVGELVVQQHLPGLLQTDLGIDVLSVALNGLQVHVGRLRIQPGLIQLARLFGE